MSILPQTSKLHKVEFRDMSHCNKITFSDKLRNLQWDTLLISNNVNVNCNNFVNKINELYHECFPIKTKLITEKRLNNPWITLAVINSIHTKNKLRI